MIKHRKKTIPSPMTQREYEYFSIYSDRLLWISMASTISISYLLYFLLNKYGNLAITSYNTLRSFGFIVNDRFDKFYDYNAYYANLNLSSYIAVIFNTIAFSFLYFSIFYRNVIAKNRCENIYFDSLFGLFLIYICAAFSNYVLFFGDFDFNNQYRGTDIIFFNPFFPILASICTVINFFAIVHTLIFITKIFILRKI